MRYAQPDDLATRVAYSELAEVVAPDAPSVDGALLKLKLGGAEPFNFESDGFPDYDLSTAVSRLERVLGDASAEIDSYIAARYGTLAQIPTILHTRCLDIAIYRLFGGDSQSERYLIYKRAIEWLAAVANGRFDLPVDEVHVENDEVEFSGTTPVMRRCDLTGFS